MTAARRSQGSGCQPGGHSRPVARRQAAVQPYVLVQVMPVSVHGSPTTQDALPATVRLAAGFGATEARAGARVRAVAPGLTAGLASLTPRTATEGRALARVAATAPGTTTAPGKAWGTAAALCPSGGTEHPDTTRAAVVTSPTNPTSRRDTKAPLDRL